MSRVISSAEESRIGALDRVLDSQSPSSTLGDELFAVVDALEAQPVLRRTLTDPGLPEDVRRKLVRQLLGGQVSDTAIYVVGEAAALHWGGGRALAAAVERQGVRAELKAALQQGQLDDVEDEMFRFGRTVAGDRQLAHALSDRDAQPSARLDLVTRLLDGRAHEATVVLARRAASARGGSFANTLDNYLTIAAQLRQRAEATVRVARPLTDEQYQRLKNALSKQVGREVEMRVVVEPELLGGVRVELGDEVIEGTVAGRLENARRTFSS